MTSGQRLTLANAIVFFVLFAARQATAQVYSGPLPLPPFTNDPDKAIVDLIAQAQRRKPRCALKGEERIGGAEW